LSFRAHRVSTHYEPDGLNRLKGLEFGVLSAGTITGGNVVQEELWRSGGTLKLDQTGNWVDYSRTREGTPKDSWTGNTANGINAYTKIVTKDGTNDSDPVLDKKGMPTQDDVKLGVRRRSWGTSTSSTPGTGCGT
jgi:hypothetical protein